MSLLDPERVGALMERAGLGSLPPRAQRAVLLAAALVIVVGLWRFWPSAPAPEIAFDAEESPAGAEAEGDAPAEGAPDSTGEVVVHVVGAVLHPGVYALDTGSRVADAIDAAGGALGSAALESLNLARVLADGEQVCVITQDQAAGAASAGGVAGTAPSGASARGLVDINRASAQELDALPGVGPSTAEKIISDREANGPFRTPEDLMRVPGIGQSKYESLKDLVTCG